MINCNFDINMSERKSFLYISALESSTSSVTAVFSNIYFTSHETQTVIDLSNFQSFFYNCSFTNIVVEALKTRLLYMYESDFSFNDLSMARNAIKMIDIYKSTIIGNQFYNSSIAIESTASMTPTTVLARFNEFHGNSHMILRQEGQSEAQYRLQYNYFVDAFAGSIVTQFASNLIVSAQNNIFGAPNYGDCANAPNRLNASIHIEPFCDTVVCLPNPTSQMLTHQDVPKLNYSLLSCGHRLDNCTVVDPVDNSGKLSTPVIITIISVVICSLAVISGVIGIVYCNRKKSQDDYFALTGNFTQGLMSKISNVESLIEERGVEFIPWTSLKKGQYLGQGQFGVVYRGVYKNEKKKSADVAIKQLISNGSEIEEFLEEIKIVSAVNHNVSVNAGEVTHLTERIAHVWCRD